MTVNLATGASVTAKKHVVRIIYTLKEVQYDIAFNVLDLNTSLMSSLVYRGSDVMSHKSSGKNI